MISIVEVHVPTDACVEDHCHWHNVDEPGPGYMICGECGHLFRRARDLRRAVRRMRWKLLGVDHPSAWLFLLLFRLRCYLSLVHADRVTFCPVCSHDF